ncbi:MAG: ACT domain-containing protein [Elusimicrobiota bacterium]
MKKSIVTQFTVALSNKPGVLAEFTKYFSEKQVNLIGISIETLGDIGFIRFIVQENVVEVQNYLLSKGYKVMLTDVFQLEIVNKPGYLFELANLLGTKNINIMGLYGSVFGFDKAMLYLTVDQFELAKPLLEKELVLSH